MKRAGKSDQAEKWYAKAHAIREDKGLLGKQWDIRGGRLVIVDGATDKLSLGGAPLIPPYARKGGNDKAFASLERKMDRLQGVTGKVNAKKGDNS
jgi:hypothetical protein